MQVNKIQKYTNNFYKGVYKPKKVDNLLNTSTKKVSIIGLGTLFFLYMMYNSVDYIKKMYQMYLYKQSKRREEKLYKKYCGQKLDKTI